MINLKNLSKVLISNCARMVFLQSAAYSLREASFSRSSSPSAYPEVIKMSFCSIVVLGFGRSQTLPRRMARIHIPVSSCIWAWRRVLPTSGELGDTWTRTTVSSASSIASFRMRCGFNPLKTTSAISAPASAICSVATPNLINPRKSLDSSGLKPLDSTSCSNFV